MNKDLNYLTIIIYEFIKFIVYINYKQFDLLIMIIDTILVLLLIILLNNDFKFKDLL